MRVCQQYPSGPGAVQQSGLPPCGWTASTGSPTAWAAIKGGETASRVAVQVLKNALRPASCLTERRPAQVGMEAANRRVYDMARQRRAA